MGPKLKFSCPNGRLWVVPILALTVLLGSTALPAQEEQPADEMLQLKRRVIEEQQRATVCEVTSSRLEQRIVDLEEQLASTRHALAALRGGEPGLLSVPPVEDLPIETPLHPNEPIEETELEDPSPPQEETESTETPAAPGEAPGVPSAGAAPATGSVPTLPTEEAVTLYDEGYTLFNESRYEEAEQRFLQYIERYPGTDLTDNAQFWVGECRYAQKKYEQALEAFTATVARYPEGNKVPDALLKAGKCLEALGEKEQARRTYQELISRFPNSAAAANAGERLAKEP